MSNQALAVAAFMACISSLATSQAQAPGTAVAGSAELEALRAEVATASTRMLVNGADVQLRFPYAPLVVAVGKMNGHPEAERTINIQSTAANGKFWGDGPTWCNSYLE